MPVIDFKNPPDIIDEKEFMPMYTNCPVCGERAYNPWNAGYSDVTEKFPNHPNTISFMEKGREWKYLYAHDKCI